MKLSGYTYVRNAVELQYPFRECIESMLNACDEVVVVDASSKDDGTKAILNELMKANPKKLNVFEVEVDWSKPNFGVFDGQLKATARSQCTGDYLLQMDSDEILEENARQKIDNCMVKLNWLNAQSSPPLAAFPVVEYWGSAGKVRIDVNPWKWRISKNIPQITHGIPAYLRTTDPSTGLLYAKHGTDGCDYIDSVNGNVIPCANFVDNQIEMLRRRSVFDPEAAKEYEKWFNVVVEELPTIYHFSWWSVDRKIKAYELIWTDFWKSLYNDHSKPEGWNPFFLNEKLSDISDENKHKLAVKLETETGGHIFHSPWTGLKTNSIEIKQPLPKFITKWCEENKTKS